MAKHITLNNGMVATVSDRDYPRVSRLKWIAFRKRNVWYAVTATWANRQARNIYLHHFIMPAKPGMTVDHKDRNGLNNQRSNLRYATHSQNMRNSKGRSHSTSPFRCVQFRRDLKTKPWLAYINVNGKRKNLGYFGKPEQAARAYDAAAKKHYGKFAVLNFPKKQAEKAESPTP